MDRGGEALAVSVSPAPHSVGLCQRFEYKSPPRRSPVRYSNYSFIPAVLLPRRRTTYLLVQEQDIVGREIQGLAPNDLRWRSYRSSPCMT